MKKYPYAGTSSWNFRFQIEKILQASRHKKCIIFPSCNTRKHMTSKTITSKIWIKNIFYLEFFTRLNCQSSGRIVWNHFQPCKVSKFFFTSYVPFLRNYNRDRKRKRKIWDAGNKRSNIVELFFKRNRHASGIRDREASRCILT